MSAPDSSGGRTRGRRGLALTTQRSIVGAHVELRKGRFWRDGGGVWGDGCGGGGDGGVVVGGASCAVLDVDPSTSSAGTLALPAAYVIGRTSPHYDGRHGNPPRTPQRPPETPPETPLRGPRFRKSFRYPRRTPIEGIMNSVRLLRAAATRARPCAALPRRRVLLNGLAGHRYTSTEAHERPAVTAAAATTKSAAKPKEVRLTAESWVSRRPELPPHTHADRQ